MGSESRISLKRSSMPRHTSGVRGRFAVLRLRDENALFAEDVVMMQLPDALLSRNQRSNAGRFAGTPLLFRSLPHSPCVSMSLRQGLAIALWCSARLEGTSGHAQDANSRSL